MTDVVIVNGQRTDHISVYDRGLAYGDGVFETIRCNNGKLQLWDKHQERLKISLERLQIQPYDIQALLPLIQPYLKTQGSQVIKIIVTRGNSQRGYALPYPIHANTVIIISDLSKSLNDTHRHGIKAKICETRLGYQPRLAGIKHLNRLEQILAQAELADTEYEEGIMLGQQGEVIETIRHNLFLVKNGEFYTPELSKCGVAGIIRTFIVEMAQRLGITVHVGIISVEQLLQADEIFLTNSINGIWPICEINDTQYNIGKVTCSLQNKLVELIQHHD